MIVLQHFQDLQDLSIFAPPLRCAGRLLFLFLRRVCAQVCCFAEVGFHVFCLRLCSHSFFVGIFWVVFQAFFNLGFQLLHRFKNSKMFAKNRRQPPRDRAEPQRTPGILKSRPNRRRLGQLDCRLSQLSRVMLLKFSRTMPTMTYSDFM